MTTAGNRIRMFISKGPLYSGCYNRSVTSRCWYLVTFEAREVAGVVLYLRHPLMRPPPPFGKVGEWE